MNKTKMFKKVICVVIALMMLMPSMPSNLVSAESGATTVSTLTPGTVSLTKEAQWIDYANRIAEITLTAKGEPVKTAADIVLVVDTSGSMGLGYDDPYSPCTNPNHWITGEHINDSGSWKYKKDKGCTDRMDDAIDASTEFVNALLENNTTDEYGNKNRIALVPFDSGVVDSYSNDFTSIVSTVLNNIEPLNNPGGGTNYTAALGKASEYIKNRNKNDGKDKKVNSRPTYIVMLSDGKPSYDSWDGKEIADDLKTFTGEPITLYSVGLNMGNIDATDLKNIATDNGANGYYTNVENTGTDLLPLLQKIASSAKPAGKNAVLSDVISQYFDYYTDSTYKPNKEITQSSKNVTWNIGTITKNEQVLKFYVKLKNEYVKGTYPTNQSVNLSFTPIGNNPGSKTSVSPQLSVECGSIVVNYLLVDEATGKYIATDGNLTDDIDFAQRVGGTVSTDQDYKTYTIVPEAPAGYTLYSDAVAQNIILTHAEKDKIVNFKVCETRFFNIDTSVTNGTITNDVEVAKGSAKTIEYAPFVGYKLSSVTIDGVPVDIAAYPTSYEFANVTANHTISATFAIDTNTVSYVAGDGGSITGTATQTVNYGGSTTEVTAKANEGYHFVSWSDGNTSATRNETDVKAGATYTATFAIDTNTVSYVAGDGGSITGTATQTVNYGGSTTEVTAKANEGYHFVSWSDGNTSATRNETDVKAGATYTASFATQTIDIIVEKIWADDENEYPNIIIKLWAGSTEINSKELENGVTSYTFSNLPIYDGENKIEYSVTEDALVGYEEPIIEGPYEDGALYVYITNTLKSFTVNYNANGGTGTTPDEEVYKYGSPVETIVNQFEKAGNTFTGWNTKANGTGYPYDEEEIFEMPAEDVTLYAQWTPNTGINYTVFYVDEDTNTNLDSKVVGGKVFGDTVTESAIDFEGYVKQDPTSKSITLGESDNEMKFYYKVRTDIKYVVNYLESGTNNVLSEPKEVTSQTFGDEVTEYAIDIEGKNKVGSIEKTITLGVENNIINFYYSDYEVIDESDYYTINWNYETGYNTNDYNQRYTKDGEGSVSENDVTNFVQLHYDSGYTYSTYTTKTSKYAREVVVDTTSGSAITGSAITGTAIIYETTTTVDLYYDRNGSSKPNRPNKPVIIEDPEIPLAELEKSDHFAYIVGYPEGDVRPLNNITREEVAMIFYRLLTDESRNSLLSDTNPFTDMTSDRWSNRAISTLYNAGILEGYLDGTFKPSDPISRAEFATIAAKFDKLELGSNSKFADIAGHWAEKYITSSEVKGWIKGYEDNTFRPNQDITRAESMTLINNVLERAVPEENIHPDAMLWPDNLTTAWYFEAVEEATNSHDYIYEDDGDELWTGMKANKIWP